MIAQGHTELDMMMDWGNSSATQFVLYNRQDAKGKGVYISSTNSGFQRTDCALMSFDIRLPDVAAEVSRDYDCIRDGAEVEIIASQTNPNQHTALTVKVTSPPKTPFKTGMVYRLDRLASRDQTRRMMSSLQIVLAQ